MLSRKFIKRRTKKIKYKNFTIFILLILYIFLFLMCKNIIINQLEIINDYKIKLKEIKNNN